MLTKSQLKQVFAQYNFRPLKRYGENYLIDGNIKDKILECAALSKSDRALEIGPGFGALTVDAAASGAKICAVEKDRKAFSILRDIVGQDFPNLKLINQDILDFDLNKAAGAKKLKVVGNLPYYITTPIIERLIEKRKVIKFAVLMVQREVANRILAKVGQEDYSCLSCFIQYHTRPTYIHTVKRTSFYPAPEVDSSLIRLDMLDEPSVCVGDEGLFFRIVRGAFGQRRKSVINSLSRKEVLDMPKDRLSAVLRKACIDPAARPEILALADFANIAAEIS